MSTEPENTVFIVMRKIEDYDTGIHLVTLCLESVAAPYFLGDFSISLRMTDRERFESYVLGKRYTLTFTEAE